MDVNIKGEKMEKSVGTKRKQTIRKYMDEYYPNKIPGRLTKQWLTKNRFNDTNEFWEMMDKIVRVDSKRKRLNTTLATMSYRPLKKVLESEYTKAKAKVEKKQEKGKEVRRKMKSLEERDVVLNVDFEVDILYKPRKDTDRPKLVKKTISKPGNIVKNKDVKKMIEKLSQDVEDILINESYILQHEIKKTGYAIKEIPDNPSAATVPMKSAISFGINGDGPQTWGTKTGRCVHDYIIARYGKIKGFKTICTYKKLNELFMDYDEIESKYMYPNSLEHGVCTNQIELFAKKMSIPMYALDQDCIYFKVYNPEKRNHNAPALMFRVFNNHFYPVENDSKRKSILKAVSNHLTQSEVFRSRSKGLEEVKFKDFAEIKAFEDVTNPTEVFVNVMKEQKTQPIAENIYFDGEHVRSFKIKNTLYTINQDMEMLKSIYENNLQKPYYGQSISTLLFDIIEKAGIKIPKSTPNPHVYRTLIEEGVKSRTHYGCVNGWTEEKILASEYLCLDIAKCYSDCMYKPYDDWIVLDFNDNWEDFDGHLRHGLYYVETDDYTLMC